MQSAKRVLAFGALMAVAAVALRSDQSLARGSAAFLGGFGRTVLVGDGEVFVGEAANSFRPGMVYVYRRTNAGWQEATSLTGPSAAVSDGFGSSLAVDGTTLFVGSAAGSGSIHIFSKQGNNWTLSGSISTEDVLRDTTARFGTAIAASGDWLLVGKAVAGGGRGGRGGRGGGGRGGRGQAGGPAAPAPAGAVYAFRRGSNGRFSYTTTLMSSDSAQSAGDAFGSSISMSGSTAIIGATGQANRAGVVHEFAVDASGMWSSVSSFAPVGLGDNDAFGSSVLLSGTDEAIVAAPGDAGGYGALYVLRKAPPGRGGRGGRGGGGRGGRGRGGANANWQEQARLTAPVGNTGDGFGSAIAAHDREVWAAAPGARGSGGVYVFSGNVPAGSFEGVNFLAPTGVPAGGGQAGASISVRGNVAAVGVPGATRDGGVIIYEWNGEWREQPIIIADVDEIDPLTGSERKCGPGGSVEMFECGSVELYSFLPPSKLTHDGHYIQMSDVWGWTDPQTGKDWALVGRRDGTTFIDISNPANPVSVADLPLTDGARPASWRDIKVYKDHAYIVADGAGPHGMQVVDLSRLRTMRPQSSGQPARIDADLLYRDINSAHNIVINEESGFAYSVGTSGGGDKTCGGGLHMIDIRTPKNPTFVGCFADTTTGRSGTGYSHDAVCINYNGPDTQYRGHEICVGSNENSISIADVTDKQNPKALARATYPRVAYAHQGWFTTDHRYFYLDDEADELAGVVGTRTMIYDVTDLDNPRLAKEHIGVSTTSDHNLYIVGNLMYQANYRSGLRVLDIRDPLNPKEIGFFDTAPYTQNAPGYNGAWSVYPFFKSGTILVTSIEQGIFMLKGPAIVF